MTFGPLRRKAGVPTASDFAGADPPLVVDGTTGRIYSITDADVVVPYDQYAENGLVLGKASGIGIKVDVDAPTYGWRDMLGPIRTRTGSATAPSFSAYLGSIYQWSFGTAPGVTEVFNEFHIQHDYVPNTDMYIHTHWSTITAPTGNANWLFELIYAKGYSQAVFEGTAGSAAAVVVSVTQAGATAFKHEIAEVQCSAAGGLINPGTQTVSITATGTTLTASAALWTAGDIGRTIRVIGAGAAGAVLDTTISAFTSTTQVTVANAASTTVTAQNNFRWRVLDSSLIEVDGLILTRTWRDASRAADTLNVAPFLHFVDVHYQAIMGGTKQRNGPAFYT